MPEGTPGEGLPAAPQVTTAAPPGPAPTVPDGMELVPKDELANLRRASDNYRGAAPLINKLVQSGIKSPDDLTNVLTPVQRAREMGLDLNGVLNTLRPPMPATAAPEESKPLTRADLSSYMEDQKVKDRHETAAAQEDVMIRGLVDHLVGEKGSEAERRAVRGLVYDYVTERTTAYDSGPLRGQVKPLSEREFAQIKASATDGWKAIRGQHLQEIAANAGTARPAPVAPGGAGAATTSPNLRPLPGTPEHRAMVEAKLDRMQAGRSGAPLSQA